MSSFLDRVRQMSMEIMRLRAFSRRGRMFGRKMMQALQGKGEIEVDEDWFLTDHKVLGSKYCRLVVLHMFVRYSMVYGLSECYGECFSSHLLFFFCFSSYSRMILTMCVIFLVTLFHQLIILLLYYYSLYFFLLIDH